jgi:hypothetical protein
MFNYANTMNNRLILLFGMKLFYNYEQQQIRRIARTKIMRRTSRSYSGLF